MARARVVVGLTVVALLATALPVVAKNAQRPSNDDFAAATFVSELPFSDTAETSAAGIELDEPQPSCNSTDATIWYAFAPAADVNVIARTAGTFRQTVAVYSGTTATDLGEAGCSSRDTSVEIPFRALAGNTYFIQIGSSGARRGTVDFNLTASSWQEETIAEIVQPVVVQGTRAPIFSMHGRPRASAPNIYDVTVGVTGQQKTVGVLTFGLIDREIKEELIEIPTVGATVTTKISYRYDASQYECFADTGEGTSCLLKSPLKDIEWVSSGDATRAALIIFVTVDDGNKVRAEREIVIPLAGQVVGMP